MSVHPNEKGERGTHTLSLNCAAFAGDAVSAVHAECGERERYCTSVTGVASHHVEIIDSYEFSTRRFGRIVRNLHCFVCVV